MNHASIALVVVGRCFFCMSPCYAVDWATLSFVVFCCRKHLKQILHALVFFFGSDRFTVLAGKMMFRASAFAEC